MGGASKAKLLVLAVFLLGVVTGAVVQNVYETRKLDADPTGETRSQRQVSRVQDLLGLTAEQRQQWKRIVEESNPEFTRLRDENRKLTEANQPKIDELMEKTRSKVRAILTDDQKKIYEDYNEKMRKVREARSRPQKQ